MTITPEDFSDRALAHLLGLEPGRHLVAIVGPPGGGKSTVSALLDDKLRAAGRSSVVVPMDGFHLDNRILEARGLLPRKGAPETFDAAGFVHLVERIARGETGIVYPVFDRARDIAIAGAVALPEDVEFVLFEGNYLLLDAAPWSDLSKLWSTTILVDAPLDVLKARLDQRWQDAGLPEEVIRAKVDGNDMPNVRLVLEQSRPADLRLSVVETDEG